MPFAVELPVSVEGRRPAAHQQHLAHECIFFAHLEMMQFFFLIIASVLFFFNLPAPSLNHGTRACLVVSLRFGSCGGWAWWAHGMWDISSPTRNQT